MADSAKNSVGRTGPTVNDTGLSSTALEDACPTRRTPNYPPWVRNDLERDYYDSEWGVPVTNERGMFERVCLEGFQAGLSWYTVLSKRDGFRTVFAGFDPQVVAAFTEDDAERILQDERIIRNQLKVRATISNARLVLELRERAAAGDEHLAGFYLPNGMWVEPGLPAFIWSHLPERTITPSTVEQVPASDDVAQTMSKAFKKMGGKFLGPTSCYALMCAIGMVDAHLLDSHRRGVMGLFDERGYRLPLRV